MKHPPESFNPFEYLWHQSKASYKSVRPSAQKCSQSLQSSNLNRCDIPASKCIENSPTRPSGRRPSLLRHSKDSPEPSSSCETYELARVSIQNVGILAEGSSLVACLTGNRVRHNNLEVSQCRGPGSRRVRHAVARVVIFSSLGSNFSALSDASDVCQRMIGNLKQHL